MILNGKIFVSNCDSTRNLSTAEIQHRLLVSILFAEGIICSPNHLIDNLDAIALLKNRTLKRWYSEEGRGSIIIRTPVDLTEHSLTHYFDQLPGDHYFHFARSTKANLTNDVRTKLRKTIEAFDHKIDQYDVKFERADIRPDSLKKAILGALDDENADPIYADFKRSLHHVDINSKELVSRSNWYAHINESVADPALARKIKLELVDSRYNKLFVNDGEAYAMDRIAHLSLLPPKVLSFGVQIKSFKQEYKSVRSIIRAFEVISSFGTLELTKLLTDVALNAVEDAAEDRGYKWATRKNWFGLYNTLTAKIGIEVK